VNPYTLAATSKGNISCTTTPSGITCPVNQKGQHETTEVSRSLYAERNDDGSNCIGHNATGSVASASNDGTVLGDDSIPQPIATGQANGGQASIHSTEGSDTSRQQLTIRGFSLVERREAAGDELQSDGKGESVWPLQSVTDGQHLLLLAICCWPQLHCDSNIELLRSTKFMGGGGAGNGRII
jgi:hypothetical protein